MTSSPAPQTYTGGCHCGAVRYEVTTDLAQLMECNCSICSKVGHVLTFVPTDKFTLLAGENATTDYQFNKMNIHHLFCKTCGVRSYGTGVGPDGAEMRAINVRCLDGVDLSDRAIMKIDGKSF